MGAPFVRSGKRGFSWLSDALPAGQARSSLPAFPDVPSPPGPAKWWTLGREKMRENRLFDTPHLKSRPRVASADSLVDDSSLF